MQGNSGTENLSSIRHIITEHLHIILVISIYLFLIIAYLRRFFFEPALICFGFKRLFFEVPGSEIFNFIDRWPRSGERDPPIVDGDQGGGFFGRKLKTVGVTIPVAIRPIIFQEPISHGPYP